MQAGEAPLHAQSGAAQQDSDNTPACRSMFRPRTAESADKQAIAIGGAYGCVSIRNARGCVSDGARPGSRWTKQSAMENYIGGALVEAASPMQAR
jgi:hypothetical protein